MKRRDLVAKAVLLTPAVFVRTARAQDNWPSRPVTIVVPVTPGGSSDIVARTMAQNMQQALGRPIVVENRPGAGGEIGARVVARTAPDGYTLMHAPISTWAINVPLRPNLGYDPVTQLSRIMQTVRTPNVLVVNPEKIPATDLAGVVEWLKRNSRTASYSSSGIGSSDQLTAEMFKQATGTDITHVPYSGGAPATTALLTGDVQLSFQNLGSITPQIAAGRARPIMITSDQRSPLLPNVPTAAEAGLQDFVVYSWQGLGGPAGITGPLLESINLAAAASLRQRETASRFAEMGFEVVASSASEFAAFQEGEIARWRRVIQAGGITAD
jgi:tripartite-type tricarboxylate transporter receptor subunit TctC